MGFYVLNTRSANSAISAIHTLDDENLHIRGDRGTRGTFIQKEKSLNLRKSRSVYSERKSRNSRNIYSESKIAELAENFAQRQSICAIPRPTRIK